MKNYLAERRFHFKQDNFSFQVVYQENPIIRYCVHIMSRSRCVVLQVTTFTIILLILSNHHQCNDMTIIVWELSDVYIILYTRSTSKPCLPFQFPLSVHSFRGCTHTRGSTSRSGTHSTSSFEHPWSPNPNVATDLDLLKIWKLFPRSAAWIVAFPPYNLHEPIFLSTEEVTDRGVALWYAGEHSG